MAEEIKTTKSASDPSFVCPLEHGMSEEEAAQLRQAQEEAEENKNEVMFAKKEIEDLKRELWEARREKQKLESEGPEDVAALEAQVEELRGVNEDLDLENKKLQEEIGQKDDEIVSLFPCTVNNRIFFKINWRRRRRSWSNWNLVEVLQMTMN
jgi:predicted  nucleic acid-binding Zn-ribbon protein